MGNLPLDGNFFFFLGQFLEYFVIYEYEDGPRYENLVKLLNLWIVTCQFLWVDS